MALHKLTHKKAIILDRVLSFLLERGNGGFDQQAYGEFRLNDYFNGTEPTLRAINADFYITDTLIKGEVSPPYKKSSSGFVETTEHTEFFLQNGGFTQVVKEQDIQERYTIQLRKSTINTNRWMIGLTAILTFCAAFALIIQTKQDRSNKEYKERLEPQIKSLDKPLPQLDSVLKK